MAPKPAAPTRIVITASRWKRLDAEAKRRKMSMKDVAEEKFELADKQEQ